MMKVFLFICGLLTVTLAKVELSPEAQEEARLALQNPDLYDGDMAGISGPHDPERSAIVGSYYRWPQKTVPYVIDPSLELYESVILQGMEDYHRHTCVRFVKHTTEQDYIRIFAGQGCYSLVGRTGGQQPLSLGNGCLYVGTVVHELGHALGLYHEQSRSDRDNYLIIYLENVYQGMEGNFLKLGPHQNVLYTPFDYDSIMIYGNKSFSKNGLDTMVARNGQQLSDPYNKEGMTPTDIGRINLMYKC